MRAGIRKIALWAFILVSVASVPAFYVSSMGANAAPTWQAFQGSVNIIESESETPHSVKLEASLIGNPLEAHPVVNYLAIVCGEGRFSGFIVLRGAARLLHVQSTLGITQVAGKWSLGLGSPTSDILGRPGPNSEESQAFKVDIPQTAPCVKSAPGVSPQPSDPWMGSPVQLTGGTMGRVIYGGRYAGFDSPKEVEAWPVVGAFDAYSVNAAGEFDGSGPLSGRFMRPIGILVEVDANIPLSDHVDSARPAPSSSAGLRWQSFSAVVPFAELTSEDRAAQWQDWTVFTSICFGIGAATLTTVLLDWLRKRDAKRDASQVVRENRPQAAGEQSSQDAPDAVRQSPGSAPAPRSRGEGVSSFSVVVTLAVSCAVGLGGFLVGRRKAQHRRSAGRS